MELSQQLFGYNLIFEANKSKFHSFFLSFCLFTFFPSILQSFFHSSVWHSHWKHGRHNPWTPHTECSEAKKTIFVGIRSVLVHWGKFSWKSGKSTLSGTAEGEGLVGPRPHHFFAPLPPLFENQILWFYSFFRFSIWKNYFQLSALPLFTLLRGPCLLHIFIQTLRSWNLEKMYPIGV